jgi:hypothetical protein
VYNAVRRVINLGIDFTSLEEPSMSYDHYVKFVKEMVGNIHMVVLTDWLPGLISHGRDESSLRWGKFTALSIRAL